MSQPYRSTVLLILFLYVGSASTVHAQENIDVHGSIGAALVSPIGSFNALGGVPAPSGLTFSSTGSSLQPWFHLGADAEFLEEMPALRFGGRVGVAWIGMDHQADERVPIATEDGGTYLATLDHQLGLSFASLFIEPYARYRILDWLDLEAGLPFNIPVGSDYTQTMRFTDPPDFPFLDGSTEITTGQGAIPGLSALVPALSLGAEGLLPINRQGSLMLVPRLGLTIPITAWETEAGLRTVSVAGGIGIRYRFREWAPDPMIDEEGRYQDTIITRDTVVILSSRVIRDSLELVGTTVEEYPGRDTVRILLHERYQRLIPKPPSVLKASVRLAFEREDGTLIDEARLDVSTVERTRAVPILPVIVFDSNDYVIPDRYERLDPSVAKRWSESQALRTTSTHWQYHIMNVIGARLLRNPEARVTLISYDDGTATGAILNAKRTATVKGYLTGVFGIPSQHVLVENRRGQASQQPWVFLADETRTVLQPITAVDTVIDSRLPRVRITPDVVSETQLRSWVIAMRQSSDTVKVIRGEGAVPATVIWDMNANLTPEATVQGPPIQVTLTVIDREGTIQQSEPGRIVVQAEATASASGINATRTEVLRWIGADYFHTPDIELFGLNPDFDRIDVYPSASRREDFFVVSAPATVHPVGASAWFRDHLYPAERSLFDHAEIYSKSKRRP